MELPESSGDIPLSAPGWNRTTRRVRRRRRRAAIIMSTVWMFVAMPVWMYVQQTAALMDVLYSAIGLLVLFIGLTGWVAISPRFRRSLLQYPLTTVGGADRTDIYRHIGGRGAVEGRVVTAEDYHTCAECDCEFVDGIRETVESHLVLFGFPLRRRSRTTVFYCRDCRADMWGEFEVGVETLNLHRPEESTLELGADE